MEPDKKTISSSIFLIMICKSWYKENEDWISRASNKYILKPHSPCGGARVLNFMIKILFGYYFEIKNIKIMKI
jgi:hypothetical protein